MESADLVSALIGYPVSVPESVDASRHALWPSTTTERKRRHPVCLNGAAASLTRRQTYVNRISRLALTACAGREEKLLNTIVVSVDDENVAIAVESHAPRCRQLIGR